MACVSPTHATRILLSPVLLLGFLGLVLSGCGAPVLAGVAVPNGQPATDPVIVPATVQPTYTATLDPGTRAPAPPRLAMSFVSPTPTPTLTPSPMPTHTPRPTHTPTPPPTFTPSPDVPANAPNASGRTVRVPILLYHYIRPYPDRAADPLGYNLSVPPELFDEQLAWLQQQGYTSIKLADLGAYLVRGEPALPLKPVVITFDDGYVDAYTNAFPLLKKHGMIGTFFVPTGFVDNARANYLNWDQIKEMDAGGMEIGSHTINHADLSSKWVVVEQEIVQSRQVLEARLGRTVEVFAYPYGKYTARADELVSRTYLAAVDSNQGIVHTTEGVHNLRRIQVSGAWNLSGFQYFLNYWLNSPR